MNKIILLLVVAMPAACWRSDPAETVESLAANPKRLKELRQQCKTDRARLGDELCNRADEATNRRLLGDGKAPYNSPKEVPKF